MEMRTRSYLKKISDETGIFLNITQEEKGYKKSEEEIYLFSKTVIGYEKGKKRIDVRELRTVSKLKIFLEIKGIYDNEELC